MIDTRWCCLCPDQAQENSRPDFTGMTLEECGRKAGSSHICVKCASRLRKKEVPVFCTECTTPEQRHPTHWWRPEDMPEPFGSTLDEGRDIGIPFLFINKCHTCQGET